MSQMLNINDFENYSSNVLSKSVRDYFRSGANDEQTLRENCNAYELGPDFCVM
jgi:(S)-2-hydroxy-acid oxidase